MSKTTSGDISQRTTTYAVAKLLKRAQNLMVLERFAQVDPQPKNKGLSRKYRRYNSLVPATSPVAEGVTPSGQKLTYTDVICNLEQFGDILETTDVIKDTHEDNILQVNMELCGEQIADTMELIRYYKLRAGTNASFANGVAGRGFVVSPAVAGDFNKIIRLFLRNKAKPISKIISATANVATEPVAPAYFGICHTDCIYDISKVAGFLAMEKYADSTKILPGEFGKIGSIRFIASALLAPWQAVGGSSSTMYHDGAVPSGAQLADVYPIIILAEDAFGSVPLQGRESVEISVLNPEKKDKSDVLGQRGYVGWLTYNGVVILNEQNVARLEVAVTANPA